MLTHTSWLVDRGTPSLHHPANDISHRLTSRLIKFIGKLASTTVSDRLHHRRTAQYWLKARLHWTLLLAHKSGAGLLIALLARYWPQSQDILTVRLKQTSCSSRRHSRPLVDRVLGISGPAVWNEMCAEPRPNSERIRTTSENCVVLSCLCRVLHIAAASHNPMQWRMRDYVGSKQAADKWGVRAEVRGVKGPERRIEFFFGGGGSEPHSLPAIW